MTERKIQPQHEDVEHKHRNASEPQNQIQPESVIDSLGLVAGRFSASLPPPPSDNSANRALMRTMRQNAVLRMQQTQGNAAVVRRLSQNVVQRDPPAAPATPTLGQLPQPTTNGPNLNGALGSHHLRFPEIQQLDRYLSRFVSAPRVENSLGNVVLNDQ